MQLIDRIRMNTNMWSYLETILKSHEWHGDLFMVMDRPLRNGHSECEWEKGEKINNIYRIDHVGYP